ncbi:MAG: putative DNA binding domain-containing protein [Bacteroidales bacterium]|jgi:ATP-dependent DNA helicase RecG|nr:putative DNA binding domain-containing protein [Bacteroidales bacterium]
MTIEELNIILSRGENIRTEYKQAGDKVPGNFYDTVVSFLNREGGVIVLGADNDGEVTGIDPSVVEQLKKDIVTTLNNKEVINPPVNFPLYQIEKDGKIILCVKIPVSSQIHSNKGMIYDRENDSDIRIEDDSRISDMYFRKRNTFSESEIIRYLRIEDFDTRLFDKTRAVVRAADSTHPWIEANNMTILRDSQLYRRDPRTGEEGFTLASALIFGKDEVIGSILPGYKVDVLVRIHDLDRYDDRIPPLRTNLIDTYQTVMEFIKTKSYLPEKFYLEGDQRKDLRELIFRELVGNMIVHREYTSAHSTELIIYKDRVEVSNPNKPLFKGVLSLDAFNPYAKNPTIRKFFSEFRWTDELGSGVKNVKKYLKIYANGAKPVFIEDDKFRAIIPLLCPVFGDKAEKIISFLGFEKENFPEKALTGLKQLPLLQKLDEIEDTDLFLFQKGSSWVEKGSKLKTIRFQKINELKIDDFKKGVSLAEKGVKLLPKRTQNILKLLLISLTPMKVEEMMQLMSFGSRDKFREQYLNLVRKEGLVEQTIKDKPNSPDQKYVLTEKGKMFFGGFEIET